MNKISSILARKGTSAVSVSPDTTVIEALRLMAARNIGSVMVLDNGQYIGIMSERDYSRKVALYEKNSANTKVSEIMSTDLPSVTPDDTIETCMQIMSQQNVRYMPVFENGVLSGIISMSDVVRETIIMQKETINHLQNYIRNV
jgi:CBS domain-containing protein